MKSRVKHQEIAGAPEDLRKTANMLPLPKQTKDTSTKLPKGRRDTQERSYTSSCYSDRNDRKPEVLWDETGVYHTHLAGEILQKMDFLRLYSRSVDQKGVISSVYVFQVIPYSLFLSSRRLAIKDVF